MLMATRQKVFVDFSSVPVSQWRIHDRLENWGRWARGSSQQSGKAGTPMFNLYRSSEARRAYGEEVSVPIDKDDALKIHFAIVHPLFDPQCRRALQWNYLRPKNPAAASRELGVSLEGLAGLVLMGRIRLIEGGV
jgi:hypothetical protein